MDPVQNIVVIRNREELVSAQAEFARADLYICSSPDALAACQEMGANGILLKENMLNGMQGEVNLRAFEWSIDLVSALKERDAANAILYESNFYDIKAVFVQGLKFISIIAPLIEKYSPVTIGFSNDPASFFLNMWRSYLDLFYPSIRAIEFHTSCRRYFHFHWKEFLREIAARISNFQSRLLLKLRSKPGAPLLWVSGALNHLRGVVLRLAQKRSGQILFLEPEFNLEKYFFCLRHLIPFFVLKSCVPENSRVPNEATVLTPGQMVFQGKDYTAFFEKIIRAAFDHGNIKLSKLQRSLAQMLRERTPAGILLDEDISRDRRAIAATAWDRGIKTFVVSHGVPTIFMADNSARKKHCTSSVTFINSDLEKMGYQKEFFDPSKTIPLGTPRHDEIFAMLRRSSFSETKPGSSQARILLCFSQFINRHFDDLASYAWFFDTAGDLSKQYLRDLLEVAASAQNIFLSIKPHYNQESAVEDFVRSLAPSVDFRIESHRKNIFELENAADIVVATESTIVSEALLFGKPVIIMNYTGVPLTLPYEKARLVSHVTSKEELRKAFSKILNERLAGTSESENEDLSFFKGRCDGRCSERVSDYIDQALGGTLLENHPPVAACCSYEKGS